MDTPLFLETVVHFQSNLATGSWTRAGENRKVLVLTGNFAILRESSTRDSCAELSPDFVKAPSSESLGRFRPAILRRTRDFLQFRPPQQNFHRLRESDEQEPFVFVQSLRWIINFWISEIHHELESVRNNAQIPRGNAGASYCG